MIDDGGPAYPSWDVPGELDGPVMRGMSLRDYFAAAAPAAEIEGMTPNAIKECEKFLGIDAGQYNWIEHYPQMVAKARYMWADAMLRARREP